MWSTLADVGGKEEKAEDIALRRVYVIQIAPKWIPVVRPTFDPDVECLYVGQTKSPIGARFKQHRRGHPYTKKGGEAAAKIFRDIRQARLEVDPRGTLIDGEDTWLRGDLMDHLEPVEGKPEALKLERATADHLRSLGYKVIGPKKKRKRKKAKA
jgi:RNase adaptor protein for sRNA GlmZ degradation